MKLIGSDLSPFVRCVAISMNVLGLPYEQNSILVFANPDEIKVHNPLIRVPTMVLDDGEVLVESYAILDYLGELAGNAKQLISADGPERRRVMKDTAVAVGSMDRAQWAIYEYRHRPEEKVHESWAEHNDSRAIGGLRYLDGLAHATGETGWLSNMDRISQSDISAVVAYSFAKAVRPHLNLADAAPALTSFVARCEALTPFADAVIPE
jgi:glutathione S-transferase